MAETRQTDVRNRLLRTLSAEDFGFLAPHLYPIGTQLREDLIVANKPVTECYFPESGLASIVVAPDGREIEVGMIGREGLVGAIPVLFGNDRTTHTVFIQMSGEMLGISTSALLTVVEQSRSLRTLLSRYVQTLMVQMAETAFSHATLGLESRLARWLLMYHDRVDGDDLLLTHEFLSIMLGVQRAGMTLALQNLEGSGRIRGRRKRIQILDRVKLEELAHGVYGAPEAEYERLIGGV